MIDATSAAVLYDHVCTKLGRKFFASGDYDLNLVGMRGLSCTSDTFDDRGLLLWKEGGVWQAHLFWMTCDPGLAARLNPSNPKGVAVLPDGQYLGLWKIGTHHPGQPGAYETLVPRTATYVRRDGNHNGTLDPTDRLYPAEGIQFHHAGTHSTRVGRWSEGCQVTQQIADHAKVLEVAHKQVDQRGWSTFSYNLLELAKVPELAPFFTATHAG